MEGKNLFLAVLLLVFLNVKNYSATILKVGNDTVVSKNKLKNPLINQSPILTATGNQIYCQGFPMKIVTNFNILDSDDIGIDALYIQVSTGFIFGQDILTLTGNHPNISSTWNPNTAKLTLTGVSGQASYANLIAAVKDVEYFNDSSNPSGFRTFSISITQANFLPSTGHYYVFMPSLGINFNDAKIQATTNDFYGLQGYLATINAADEAQICGSQTTGTGWIGGTDEAQEGIWKWISGPENGMVFYDASLPPQSQPTFSFWNTGEPNNLNNEDYAHVTALGVGILGSWNDLTVTGENNGDYQPKGYIVEYGGMPGDPTLQISASTTISIPTITTTISNYNCGPGSITLTANAAYGNVTWYDNLIGGLPIAIGNSFTTPIISTTTTYYATAFPTSCFAGTRTPITATINDTPIISVINPNSICESGTTIITANTTSGIVNWHSEQVGGFLYILGANFITPPLTQTTTFYVDASNNGCISGPRIPVTIVVNSFPNVVDETVVLCENSSQIIDAGIPNANYLWSTGETTQTISVSNYGNYSVAVTSLENCTKTKTINVLQNDIPEIENVIVDENIISIVNLGFGECEFSIDGINYQDSNTFTINEGGIYTAYVRSKKECGEDSQNFIVLSIPKFFTPNNDGVNDTFFVKGMIYYPNAILKIFDRYGKLVGIVNENSNSWDGNYDGKILPSSDYWYILKINNNMPEIKGHFSVKR